MKDIIININTKTSVASKDDYYIGTQGQNLQNKLIFEMSEKVSGVAWLEYEIDGSKNYALMNDNENGYEIDIKSCLLVSDSVNVNLRITEEQNPTGIPIFVSTISNFKVYPSIQATDEEPEQYPSWLDIANSKIVEINEKIEEVDNIDIDVSKSGKFTTVEITKKDGTQKSESIRDGYDLDYRWNGTKLGVKREDEQEYQETDLQGQEGRRGPQGEPGYTPVKYVDYFTEEEQEEFKDEIVNDANSEFNRNVTEKTTAFNQNAMTKTNEFNSNATNKKNAFDDNVTSKTTDFNTNATNKTTDYNTNASEKLETYNTNHTNKLNAYNENASTKTSEFDSHVVSKTTEFDNNATSKTTDFNTNATNKTNDFNTNATNKTTEFNDNAQSKTDEFNTNKEKLQKNLDYYKTIINALPKVEGEGTDIILDNTADSPLTLGFKASESTQKNLTYKGLFRIPESINGTRDGLTFKLNDDGSVTITGTKGSSGGFIINLENSIALNETYTFSLKTVGTISTSNAEEWSLLDSNNASVFSTQVATNNTKYTTNTVNKTISKLQIYTLAGQTLNCTVYPILEQGSSVTDWDSATTNLYSPNPYYPQDIHVIKGDNEVIIENKNLFDINNIELAGPIQTDLTYYPPQIENGVIKSGGRLGYREGAYICIPSKNIENIIISYYATSNDTNLYYSINSFTNLGVSDNTNIATGSIINNSNNQITVNNSNNSNYIGIAFYSNTRLGISIYNLQIEEGTTATPYTEHKEQNYPLNLGVENLWNEKWETGAFNNSTGEKISNSNKIRSKDYILVKSNTDYYWTKTTSTGTLYFYDKNKNFISYRDMGSGSFTTSSNCNYIMFSIGSNSEPITTYSNDIMISLGNKPHSYNPYGVEPIEMYNINNYADEFFKNVPECEYYDDTLEEGKWYKYGRIGKVVLDGTENWNLSSGNGCWITIQDVAYNSVLLSDYFIFKGVGVFNNTTGISSYTNQHRIIVCYNGGTSTNDLITFLSTHNVTVYYILETPTKTLLSDTLQEQLDNISYAMAYQDQTNISQVNEDRPFVISASTVLDLNTLVSRVAVLESEV